MRPRKAHEAPPKFGMLRAHDRIRFQEDRAPADAAFGASAGFDEIGQVHQPLDGDARDLPREVEQIADEPARRGQGQRSTRFFAHVRLKQGVRAQGCGMVVPFPMGKGKPFFIDRPNAGLNSSRSLILSEQSLCYLCRLEVLWYI